MKTIVFIPNCSQNFTKKHIDSTFFKNRSFFACLLTFRKVITFLNSSKFLLFGLSIFLCRTVLLNGFTDSWIHGFERSVQVICGFTDSWIHGFIWLFLVIHGFTDSQVLYKSFADSRIHGYTDSSFLYKLFS